MQRIYKVDICGQEVELPILPLPNGSSIAFFNLHGNVPLTEYCAKMLAKRGINNADIIVTPESKGLQLSHCLARELGQSRYAVVRKSKKLYMQDGISVEVKSITTDNLQDFYLSKFDVELIKDKNVAIVDDVISTGGSVKALEKLIKLAEGNVVARCCVLAEGEAANRKDITYLTAIPIL